MDKLKNKYNVIALDFSMSKPTTDQGGEKQGVCLFWYG